MSIKCSKCHYDNLEDTIYYGKCGIQYPPPEEIEVTEIMEVPREELTTGSTFTGSYQIFEEMG